MTNLLAVQNAAPALGVDKSNNAPLIGGDPTASEGDTVTYTLDYTVTDGPVTNGVLTDVLPVGVTYVDGLGDRQRRVHVRRATTQGPGR